MTNPARDARLHADAAGATIASAIVESHNSLFALQEEHARWIKSDASSPSITIAVSSEVDFFLKPITVASPSDRPDRHPDEEMWIAYLDRVEGSHFTRTQIQRARAVWTLLADRFVHMLLPPRAIAAGDDILELSWSLPGLTACIEISRTGAATWWISEAGSYSEGRGNAASVAASIGDALARELHPQADR